LLVYQPVTDAELRTIKGPQPGAKALLAACQFSVPGTTSMGIYNRRPVAGTKTWSVHSSGRAIDVGCKTKAMGDALVAKLVPNADALGISQVIWYRQIWDSRGYRAYKGQNAHTDHIHITMSIQAACCPDTPALRSALVTIMNS
jgi:hypothetical protein